MRLRVAIGLGGPGPDDPAARGVRHLRRADLDEWGKMLSTMSLAATVLNVVLAVALPPPDEV